MAVVLCVRVRSSLEFEELEKRAQERRPRFEAVPGLLQKIYARDPETGDVCGIYFFDSRESLDRFRQSELARTIPEAYEAEDVRREVYDVMYPLRPEIGPLVDTA
jgi:heme-degrading monooxygenase HmoA